MVKQVAATVRSFDSHADDHAGYFYPVESDGKPTESAWHGAHEGAARAYDFPDFHRPDATDVLYGLHSERNFSSSDWYGESGKWSFEVKSYQADSNEPWHYISADWSHEASSDPVADLNGGEDWTWLGSAKEESFRVSEWAYEESDWAYVRSQWKPEAGVGHGSVAAQAHDHGADVQEFSFDVFARGTVDGSSLLEKFPEYDSGDHWS